MYIYTVLLIYIVSIFFYFYFNSKFNLFHHFYIVVIHSISPSFTTHSNRRYNSRERETPDGKKRILVITYEAV